MPEPGPTHTALAQRNRLLTQTRTISLGIAGGTALATLGLGTAFAHAIPGHSHTQEVQGRPAQPGSGLPAASGPARSPGPARSSRPARTARRGHPARRHHSIAPPAQPPAPAPSSPAPPPVSSGGS